MNTKICCSCGKNNTGFKQTTAAVAAAMGTSTNKRVNEKYNSSTHALMLGIFLCHSLKNNIVK